MLALNLARRTILVLFVSLCVGCLGNLMGCAPMGPESLSGHDAALVGTWQGTATASGTNLTISVTFLSDGTFSITGNTGLTSFTNYGVYSTDDTHTPKWINVYNQYGLNWHGVYEINGTSLKWSESLGDRPTSVDSGTDVYVLTKAS